MSSKHIGDFPVNARISIKYDEQGKPDVEFKYPENETQLQKLWAGSSISLIALPITIIIVTFLFMLIIQSYPIKYPEYCFAKPYYLNDTAKTGLMSIQLNCMVEGKNKTYWVNYERNEFYFYTNFVATQNRTPTEANIFLIKIAVIGTALAISIILIFVLVSKAIASVIKRTRFGQKFYPSYNKAIYKKNWSATFTECPENKIIELPLFKNIYLDYEADGEFSEYLESFEIKEHEFSQLVRKRFFGKTVEKRPNVYLWKAVFKFRKVPKEGFLKIEWT